MKKSGKRMPKNYDIYLLLVLLLIFSGSVAFLRGRKSSSIPLQPKKTPIQAIDYLLKDMPVKEIISQLSLGPLLISRSVEDIATVVSEIVPTERIYDVVRRLIQDQDSQLTSDDKLELIYALAALHGDNEKKQVLFFNLISDNNALFKNGSPILYIAASTRDSRRNHPSIIPVLLTWGNTYQKLNKDAPSHIADMLGQGIMYAIQENDSDAFNVMLPEIGDIDKALLNKLLWKSIEGKRDLQFVTKLIQLGADPNDIIGKYTVLMWAAYNGNEEAVQALLEANADPEMVIDIETGTAAQIAHEQKNVEVEKLFAEREK